jgi:hypothetical protein
VAEEVASSEPFRRELDKLTADPASRERLAQIYDLQKQIAPSGRGEHRAGRNDRKGEWEAKEARLEELCRSFRQQQSRRPLQGEFERLIPPEMKPPDGVASWFFCDARGVSTVRVPEGSTIGKNFAWRSYFHGGGADWAVARRPGQAELEASWRPQKPGAVKPVRLSAIFPSQATGRWIVAVSTAVFDGSAAEGKFLGVVALTVEVGRFAELRRGQAQGKDQFAVLVDWREGENQGVILQHPLFDALLKAQGRLPDRFKNRRVTSSTLPSADNLPRQADYRDPLAGDRDGGEYRRRWLAEMEPIRVRGEDTGLVVIVQEAYDAAIGSTLDGLKAGLVRRGLIALALVALVMVSLWWFATRLSVKH